MTASNGHAQHGSLGEEAGRLAEAFAGWVNSSAAGAPGHPEDVEGSPECSICPICQALRLVRGLRPEVFEHLSVASAALLAAVRAALESAPAAAPADAPSETRTRPTSQRIDIR